MLDRVPALPEGWRLARADATRIPPQAKRQAALACMAAFANTDFREDLPKVTVPAVIHSDGDKIVAFEGSGARTRASLPGR